MATVTFSAADDVLYAYLAGEIDHDAAQNLRIQLDDALLNRTPRTLVLGSPFTLWDALGFGCIFLMLVLLFISNEKQAKSAASA